MDGVRVIGIIGNPVIEARAPLVYSSVDVSTPLIYGLVSA